MAGTIGNVNRLVPGLIEKVNPGAAGQEKSSGVTGEKFTDLLSNAINAVNDLHMDAADAQKALLSGDPVELHEVMIKAEEAGLATDLILEIRNKLVSAYNEIMRMPV